MGSTGECGPLPERKLARRYARLLLAYPRDYRRRRSAEILGTLLDSARPGQRRPGLADAADLLRGGLRARFGQHRVPGLDAGLVLAGPLALALAAGLSAFLWLVCEPVPDPLDYARAWQHPTFGPFFTLGPICFAAWLLAAAGRAALPRRAARGLTWLALAATLALVPASALTGYARPALWSTGALTLLGVVALAGTGRPAPPAERIGVLVATLAAAAVPTLDVYLGWREVLTSRWPTETAWWTYRTVGPHGAAVLMAVALVVLAGAGAGYALLTRRWHGVAATVVLLPATGWLVLLAGTGHGLFAPDLRVVQPASLDSAGYYLAALTSAVALIGWLLRQRRSLVDAERARRHAISLAAGIPERALPADLTDLTGPTGLGGLTGSAGSARSGGSDAPVGRPGPARSRLPVRPGVRRWYVPVDPRVLLGMLGALVTGALGAMAGWSILHLVPMIGASGLPGPELPGGVPLVIVDWAAWVVAAVALVALPGRVSGVATGLIVLGTAALEVAGRVVEPVLWRPGAEYVLLGMVALAGVRRRRLRADRIVAVVGFVAVGAIALGAGLPWYGNQLLGGSMASWELVTLVPCALTVVAAPYAMSRWADEGGRWTLARCWRYLSPLLGLAGALCWAASLLALPPAGAVAAGLAACAVAVLVYVLAVRLGPRGAAGRRGHRYRVGGPFGGRLGSGMRLG